MKERLAPEVCQQGEPWPEKPDPFDAFKRHETVIPADYRTYPTGSLKEVGEKAK